MATFASDPRRWQRHFRDMQGMSRIFPTGSSDPSSPRIFAPWLSDTVQLNFPVSPLFGVGTPGDPAAGAEWTHTIPDTDDWKILSIRFLYTTDANAANRVVHLEFVDIEGRVILTAQGRALVGANIAHEFVFADLSYDNGLLTTHNQGPIPPRFHAVSRSVIRTRTRLIQVGDQYSEIRIYAERWPRFQ